ncbi:MAG: chemotaxis protein CheC [Lachnospiraceae bacterium]|jgi:chemotaxis protein CheC|nr:chemotaxis protein CheC [Lachnospiraceae bacterium]
MGGHTVTKKLTSYEDMNLQELDVMKEISSIGTSHAATALSKLLQKEVRISIPEVSVLGYDETVSRIGDIEELVTATLVRMSNEVDGLMLFIFKLDLANVVLEKLIGRSYDSFEQMDELDYSALEEVGNIIICSYVNAFTQLVGVEIDLSVPSSTLNMLGGILTVPMAEYGYETDKLMYINAEFIMDGKKLSDGLLMLPDIASLNSILGKLGVL